MNSLRMAGCWADSGPAPSVLNGPFAVPTCHCTNIALQRYNQSPAAKRVKWVWTCLKCFCLHSSDFGKRFQNTSRILITLNWGERSCVVTTNGVDVIWSIRNRHQPCMTFAPKTPEHTNEGDECLAIISSAWDAFHEAPRPAAGFKMKPMSSHATWNPNACSQSSVTFNSNNLDHFCPISWSVTILSLSVHGSDQYI